MKRFFTLFIRIILLTLIILSLYYIFYYCFDTYRTKEESNLLKDISLSESIVTPTTIPESFETDIQTAEPIKTERMSKVEVLQKENSDIKAWIEIENTGINFPVLQGADNDFYMNHNYKKQKSKNGAIFLDKDYNWELPSSNLLIYGHNMKNNTMFQHLLKYKDKSFFETHPIIRFTTTSEDVYYDIISVFESRVYYKSEKDVFRYYYFINAENEAEYNSYIQNAKKASLYDTGLSANYNEQLLTLSTCAYHTKDGRFVVVAKKGNNYSD